MAFDGAETAVVKLVAGMSVQEKLELLNGAGLWKTKANYRLNIPEILMTDGAHGIRYSTTQIDHASDEQGNIRDFLAVVNQSAQGRNPTVGMTRPATCFPNGSLVGCSWDVELLSELGSTLAGECHHFGVNLLLGPGINIRRTPLAGRGYEYYSEDPVLSGDLAASFISGLQDNGVGASLKHFACNNSEIERTTMSSEIDERTLREIYLAGFERAIAKSAPWTVMSSYNLINGEQVSSSARFLTDILRGEWGYEGVVMSDWHGIKDRPASLAAGNDLDMPESKIRTSAALAAINSGELPMEAVDQSVSRMLQLIAKAKAGEKDTSCDFDHSHKVARHIAAESIVLLKNRDGVLPLHKDGQLRILVVGREAVAPSIQGSGSATTNPTQIDIPLEQIIAMAGPECRVSHVAGPESHNDAAAIAVATEAAQDADVVVVFAGTVSGADGEASDRRSLRLAPGQDDVIDALADTGRRVVVVLTMPDAVEMPWVDKVDGIVAAFFAGQGGGNAIARILFGDANPCGKLSVSFPKTVTDIPGIHTYPGENDRHVYSEGIFVGYRSYDLRQMDVLFPFGHGESYTAFEYGDLTFSADHVDEEGVLEVSLTVRNTGPRFGKEVVQIYVSPRASGLRRPVRELKAFAKVGLDPQQATTVTLTLQPRDFMYYHAGAGRWVLDAEGFEIEAAASSRDIRTSKTIRCVRARAPFRKLTADTQPKYILENEAATKLLVSMMSDRLNISPGEAGSILELTRHWFLGIYQSLSWYIGEGISASDIDNALLPLNES